MSLKNLRKMQTFKIICSAIGKLMTNGRGKDAGMGETAKAYLQEWVKEQIYGVRNEVTTKPMIKGVACEDEAIGVYALYRDLGFVIKNDQHLSDADIMGTPDVVLNDRVVDTKVSWNCFTFPLFDTEPDKGYWWQLQGYMELTGKRKAELVYVLVDTPEELAYTDLDRASYADIDLKYRVKVFEIDYDAEAVAQIRARVQEAREYIKTLGI